MPKCRCEREMDQVGFARDNDGNISVEMFVCRNEECPSYKDVQTLPTKVKLE